MKHFFAPLFGLLLLTRAPLAHGQGGAPVGWLKLSADLPLRNRWSLYSEVESRQSSAQLGAQQLGRLGFRLHVAPCFSLTTGYVLAANEYVSANGSRMPEHRLYQEVALADASGRLRVGHRLRAEERWFRPAPEQAYRFAPRLRYQLRLVLPLCAGGRLPVGGPYLVAADEVFAGLGATPYGSLLEENRASAGLGYRVSRRATVEMTYLHQTQAAGPNGQACTRNAVQLSVAVATPSRPVLARR